MIKEFLYSVNYILGRDNAGRMLNVLPDDIFLVSYPKSGNTWTRFLIGNLLHPDEPLNFVNVSRLVPDLYGTSRKEFKKIPRPRIIKSHECFDPRYQRVIYIVRDPRDVAVSSYHFARKGRFIDDTLPIERYVSDCFLSTGQPYGTWGEHAGSWLVNGQNLSMLSRIKDNSLGTVGNWGENVMSWVGARGNGRALLLLRYEDLLEDTPRELAKVVQFLGIEASHQAIARAVELSSVENMRKLEEKQMHLWSTTQEGRKDIKFVREAKSEQWKKSLPPVSVNEIEAQWGPIMQLLGYTLVGSSQAADHFRGRPFQNAPLPES
jgi:hypothetical protein